MRKKFLWHTIVKINENFKNQRIICKYPQLLFLDESFHKAKVNTHECTKIDSKSKTKENGYDLMWAVSYDTKINGFPAQWGSRCGKN